MTRSGVHKGYDYSRVSNPTRTALQTVLASLEGAEYGAAYSSGIGATTTLMHLVNPGERVVCVNDVYGGAYPMFSQVYEPKGYAFDFSPGGGDQHKPVRPPRRADADRLARDSDEPDAERGRHPRGRGRAHQVGAIVVVDNTFASPYLQRPLEHGADLVLHSTTKYIGGHSDLIGGYVATSDPTIAERLYFLQKSLGADSRPFDLLSRCAA